MAHSPDMEQLQEELAEAYKWGEEARARQLVARLATQPRKARTLFERMFSSPDARLRQAAAFCLGELGGPASARRLEQQFAMEEARDDHDGAAVAEAITEALGRIEEAGARAALVRKPQRLPASTRELGEVSSLANALWKRRHPELLPVVRQGLERLDPRVSNALRGLLVLLETSPGELSAWARDASAPLENKTSVLTVLEEEVPGELLPALPPSSPRPARGSRRPCASEEQPPTTASAC